MNEHVVSSIFYLSVICWTTNSIRNITHSSAQQDSTFLYASVNRNLQFGLELLLMGEKQVSFILLFSSKDPIARKRVGTDQHKANDYG